MAVAKYRRACVLLLATGILAQPLVCTADESAQWLAHNRSLSFAAGQQRQAYRELDSQGLTTDGVLNRESGTVAYAQAALRWQWVNGITAQLAVARHNGATAYQGYLQNGAGNLTPYSARTGNVSSQTRWQLGYALNASRRHARISQPTQFDCETCKFFYSVFRIKNIQHLNQQDT